MSEYFATIQWMRDPGAQFVDKRYGRGHQWKFDQGLTVPASASPAHVPSPYSVAAAVDPEEAFVASLSSCHMLWFLWIAAERGFIVDSYTDAAAGQLGPDSSGRTAMTRVTLRPEVRFSGEALPTPEELTAMHHKAHEECYIANSVRTEVLCVPVVTAT